MTASCVLAIDPGTTESAWLHLDHDGTLTAFGIMPNEDLAVKLATTTLMWSPWPIFAIEMIASYGMAVGKSTFETCVWIGRFTEAALHSGGPLARWVYRGDVKMHLCGSMRAKDKNVSQALLDRYGNGVRRSVVGVKAAPGPLYGVTSHVWSALGVAVTAQDTMLPPRWDASPDVVTVSGGGVSVGGVVIHDGQTTLV